MKKRVINKPPSQAKVGEMPQAPSNIPRRGSIVAGNKILDAPAQAIPANVHKIQTENTNTQTAMIHQTTLDIYFSWSRISLQ